MGTGISKKGVDISKTYMIIQKSLHHRSLPLGIGRFAGEFLP